MEVKVLNKEGKETGRSVSLPSEVFGIEPNDHAIYLDVKQYLANQRQGTHKTKEKGEIHRSTRKIFRQKGTGGARHGSLKAGIYVGGARIHGPRPRDYSFKLNKKLKKLARNSALSYKAKNSGILIVEDFDFAAPKTSEFTAFLKALNINGRSLFVTPEVNKNVYLSGRNIQGNEIMRATDINTYAVMKAGTLIITENAVNKINSNQE